MNLDLNTSRPLFANADLRKAVNYALDRRAIARAYRPLATPTDQYLQSAIPGFRDTHVYPLTRSLAKARRLARGHRGHAVLYACATPACREVAHLIRSELAPIGISVEIKWMSSYYTIFNRAGFRSEPFDMALDVWYPVYPDPSNVLNYLFDGRSIRAVDEQQPLLLRRSRLQPQARRRRPAHRPAALRRVPGARNRPLAQRRTVGTALQLPRSRLLLRPHRLSGLPAHLPNRPRCTLPRALPLTRQIPWPRDQAPRDQAPRPTRRARGWDPLRGRSLSRVRARARERKWWAFGTCRRASVADGRPSKPFRMSGRAGLESDDPACKIQLWLPAHVVVSGDRCLVHGRGDPCCQLSA